MGGDNSKKDAPAEFENEKDPQDLEGNQGYENEAKFFKESE